MSRFGAFNNIGLAQAARLSALGLTGLLLANCSGGQMAGKIDPRYGVAASARAVEPGQPVPKGGGVYRVGKPYTVAGRVYVPEENTNYSAEGMASWYGDDFHGRYTANGEIFRHGVDFGSTSDTAAAVIRPRDKSRQPPIDRGASQRSRALCARPHHRRLREDRRATWFLWTRCDAREG